MSAPVAAGRRPGSMIVCLAEKDGDHVVWFGASRYLDKAGQIVTRAVRMTAAEAEAACAPEEP